MESGLISNTFIGYYGPKSARVGVALVRGFCHRSRTDG